MKLLYFEYKAEKNFQMEVSVIFTLGKKFKIQLI